MFRKDRAFGSVHQADDMFTTLQALIERLEHEDRRRSSSSIALPRFYPGLPSHPPYRPCAAELSVARGLLFAKEERR